MQFFRKTFSNNNNNNSNNNNNNNNNNNKGLFTRRESYPSEWVKPNCKAKDSPGLQAKFYRLGNPTTGENLMDGYIQRVWKQLES